MLNIFTMLEVFDSGHTGRIMLEVTDCSLN